MKFSGAFLWETPQGTIVTPNMVTEEGGEHYSKMIFRNDDTISEFYIGLCDADAAVADTMSDITGEPSSAGGYARQLIERSALGWESIVSTGGITTVTSKLITFAASGADYNKPFQRAFLCSVETGNSGILFGYGQGLEAPITITDGDSRSVRYQLRFG